MPQFNLYNKVVFVNNGVDANGQSYEIGFLGQIADYNSESGLYSVKTEDKYYEGISESELDNLSSAYELAVNKRLDIAEKNKEIKDSEDRIVYAKKFKRAFKTISMANLSDLEKNEALAVEMVKKDKIFPKVDAEAEKDAGVESGAAFFKTKIRSLFPNSPEKNSSEYRRVYVYFANYIQANIIEKAKTLEKVVSLCEDMYKDTLRLYIMAIDETGELEKKIEDELLQKRIELKKATDLLAEASIEYFRFENDLKDRYGENVINKYQSPTSDYRILWHNMKDLASDSEILMLKAEYSLIMETFSPIFISVSVLEDSMTETEYEFAEKLYRNHYNYSDTSVVSESQVKSFAKNRLLDILLENVFGKKFSSFLYSPRNYKGIFSEAKSFNPLSEIELKHGEELIKNTKESIIFGKTIKFELELANDLQALQGFFEKYRQGTTYSYLLKNTAFYYKASGDIMYYLTMYDSSSFSVKRNQRILLPSELDDFIFLKRKNLVHIEEELKNQEKRLDELKQKYLGANEERWTWANIKRTQPTERVSITINSQTPLSHIERLNGVSINEDIFENDEGIKSFYSNILGINRITYGKSLPDDERQAHAYHFAISLIDFCDVLNWDLKSFTSQLNLGIGFAISGSGKASATYTRTPANYINLTRRRGDGSLAHELIHYIDNFSSSDKLSMATDFQHSNRYWYYPKVNDTNLKYVISDFFRFVIKGTLDSYIPDDLRSEFVKSDIYFTNRTTNFYFMSSKLSNYWTKKWELFARACECYIYDKLLEKNMANNYLVSGEYFDSSYGVYPMGVERKISNILLERIFNKIKDVIIVNSFIPPNDQRENYYKILSGETNDESEGEEINVYLGESDKLNKIYSQIDELVLILQNNINYDNQ